MALTVCRECNAKISDETNYCPQCGCPLRSRGIDRELVELRNLQDEAWDGFKGKIWIFRIIFAAVGAAIVLIFDLKVSGNIEAGIFFGALIGLIVGSNLGALIYQKKVEENFEEKKRKYYKNRDA